MNEENQRTSGPLVMVALVTAFIMGCSRETTYKMQVPFVAPVLELGNARKITDWILAQQDPDKVNAGLDALSAIITFRSRGQAQDACEGYVRVYQKLLAGWPGLAVPMRTEDGVDWTLESLVDMSTHRARREAETHPDYRIHQELWTRIQAIHAEVHRP
jgi:hypothetical protein